MSDLNKNENVNNGIVQDIEIKRWGYRHQQCLILFCGLTVAYSMRACMGMALVAMTEKTVDKMIQNVTTDAVGFVHNVSEAIVNATNPSDNGDYEFKPEGVLNALLLGPPYPKFSWTKKVQDAIQTSFFVGYMMLQIPGGQLAHRFGARLLLTSALLINCIVSICLPLAASYGGWICASVCRFLQGLSQACIVPGMHTHLGKWAPLQERSRMASWTYGGQALGPVIGLPITAFIASSSFSWPGIFYFYGMLSGVFGGILWWFGADTPAQHPKISLAERRYIEEGIGQKFEDSKKPKSVPWLHILRSRGMYAIIFAHIGQTWGQLTLYSEVPAFMNSVMGVNIKANGMLTALPFLVMWFTNFFFSWMTDMLIVKKILSVTHTRKLANSLGCVPSSIGLLALAYVPKNIYAVETVLVTICAFKISAHSGFQVNHIDISPNFAGTMMSISNFVSNLIGCIAPMVAGLILTDDTDEFLWRKVFFVASGLYFFTNLLYVIMGTSDKAPWNDLSEDEDTPAEDDVEIQAMLQVSSKDIK